MNKKHKDQNGFSAIEGLLILIIIGVIGFVGWYIWHRDRNQTQTQKPPTNTSTTISGLKINYIDMPSHSEYKGGSTSQNDVATAKGHYALVDDSEPCNGPTACGFDHKGSVIYDGKVVYRGQFDISSVRISANGLHLSYSKSSEDPKYKVAISNNGKDYAYLSTGDCKLYVNTETIYTYSPCSDHIYLSDPTFSADLTHFIATVETNIELPEGGNKTYIVFDGNVAKDQGNSGNTDVRISDNGEHYLYSVNNIVVVDGKTVATTSQSQAFHEVSNEIITDQGKYAYVECDNKANAHVHSAIASYDAGSCSGSADQPHIALTDDGQHVFYISLDNEANTKGYLDGKLVNLSGKISDIEFDGNTLNVYRWAN